MFNNMLMGAAGESIKATSFPVDNSMVLNDDDSQYLIRTNASATTTGGSDAQKKFTISLWWKHGNISSDGQILYVQNPNSSNYLKCAIAGSSGNPARLQFLGATTGAFSIGDTTAVLRDFHAWYHILFYYDSTDGTAADRARIYLNGVRLTDFIASATNPGSGATTQFGSNNPATIGRNQASNGYSDGYMAEMVVIDGQALTPDNFTETDTNGVLRPLDISAQNFTFGDQGFYLPFTASGALGADYGTTRTAPSIAFVTSNSSTTNTTSSYTFSSQSLGAAASDRKIFLCASMSAHTVATLAFGTVTIGGVTATQLVASETYPDPHNLHPMAIFVADVPSGTTGDIVLNVGSGHSANCGIAIYRATACGEMFDSGSIKGNASGGGLSVTTQVPKGGFVLLHGNKNSEATRVTLTNVTEDYDFACEPDAGGDLGIFGGLNTSAASSDAVGLTTTATSAAGSAFGQISISVAPIGDTSLKAVNSPTQSTDSPTTNAATLSQLWTDTTLSNGNLKAVATGNSYQWAISTIAIPSSGKWTFEAQSSNIDGSSKYGYVGICQMGNHNVKTGNNYIYGINAGSGEVVKNSSALVDVGSPAGTSLWRIEYDADNDTIKIFDDGAEVFPASTGVSNTVGLTGQNSLHFFVAPYGSGADFTVAFKGLSGTPTTDYNELNATNLLTNSTLTIEDGSAYMQATTYTGNGGSQSIDQSGNSTFKPDLLWTKKINGTSGHALFDSVRTNSSGQFLRIGGATGTAVETDEAGFASFDSDGFSWDGAGTEIDVNANTGTFVGWQWFAGGTPTATNSAGTGATPTAGSVKVDGSNHGSALSGTLVIKEASVNTKSGFSIIQYTGNATAGATFDHLLGQTPQMVIIKPMTEAEGWVVYHEATGNTGGTFLNTSGAFGSGSHYFNNTSPTSSLFTVSGHIMINGSGEEMIAYCFASIPGFSKFGSYVGNGNVDGPFVDLGFKPAFWLTKTITSGQDWAMSDNARSPINVVNSSLSPNATAAEYTHFSAKIDFLSNGVKMKGIAGTFNESGTSILYMAFAENPFAGTTPATAR